MGFGNRKLMDESLIPSINSTMSTQTTNGTLPEFCKPSCDPLVNGSGYCISPCLNVCPTNCRYAISPPDYPLLSDYYPLLPPPPPPPPPVMRAFSKHHVPPLLITAFVALSLAVLIVLGYVIYIRIYGRRGNRGGRDIAQPQRALPPQDDGFLDDLEPALDHPIWYIRTVGLEPSVISKISLCKYKRGEGLIEGTDCSVCLTEFEEDETLRLLPKCSHAFHVPCIDTWLQSHTNCPNCRAPIMTGTGRSPSPELSNNWEEIRLDDGTGDADLGREVESTPQSRGETEEETEELSANRSQDTVDESKNELQLFRRSVSVDSSSAAKISLAVADFLMAKPAGTSDPEPVDEENQDPRSKRFADSSNPSLGRSVQKLTGSSSSINRSLSWSGRFLASKYSRNRSSLLPL